MEPESVAEHMHRMSICAMLAGAGASTAASGGAKVDVARCVQMAVVHDLAEALAGDITPHDGVSDADKRKLEEVSTAQFLFTGVFSSLYPGLWLEYEAGTSPEARFVKDLDKFEMILQADDYERGALSRLALLFPVQFDADLSDFFRSTAGKFRSPQVQAWDRELREQRERR
ncbi:unnamed protein product, partial [Phaeothamnion confervicola]